MTTIVHISDLHFGHLDERTLAPLSALINTLQPDVVVVSGDLTQRAKIEHFKPARAWLDTLTAPKVVVPGNHDVSLTNIVERFLHPLENFQAYITDNLYPTYQDEHVCILGINTARSLALTGGRVSDEQLEYVKGWAANIPQQVTKMVVMHHPLDLDGPLHNRVHGAEEIQEAFEGFGVNVVLSGHMHNSWVSSEGVSGFGEASGHTGILHIHAGTATSTRLRGEVNAFNVVHVNNGEIELEQYRWDEDQLDYKIVAQWEEA